MAAFLVIAGITLEGTKVAAAEARRAVKAGASAGLVYPSHGWLRFGYQKGAPQDRYRAIFEESGLPLILFQYPDVTKATYNLETQLDIAAQPGVFAMKNGVRNMRRWDREIPVIRKERPNLQVLTCHDEYLLHTMFDVDGALVGYGCIAPEPLIEMIAAGKAKDYAKARALHDRLLPVTANVYHRRLGAITDLVYRPTGIQVGRMRAARRGRHHLRSASERDGRCGQPLHQIRQCHDSARRLRSHLRESGHRRAPARRAARRVCPKPPCKSLKPPIAPPSAN